MLCPQQIPKDGLHILPAIEGPRGAGAGSDRGAEHVAALALAVPRAGTQHLGRRGRPAHQEQLQHEHSEEEIYGTFQANKKQDRLYIHI